MTKNIQLICELYKLQYELRNGNSIIPFNHLKKPITSSLNTINVEKIDMSLGLDFFAGINISKLYGYPTNIGKTGDIVQISSSYDYIFASLLINYLCKQRASHKEDTITFFKKFKDTIDTDRLALFDLDFTKYSPEYIYPLSRTLFSQAAQLAIDFRCFIQKKMIEDGIKYEGDQLFSINAPLHPVHMFYIAKLFGMPIILTIREKIPDFKYKHYCFDPDISISKLLSYEFIRTKPREFGFDGKTDQEIATKIYKVLYECKIRDFISMVSNIKKIMSELFENIILPVNATKCIYTSVVNMHDNSYIYETNIGDTKKSKENEDLFYMYFSNDQDEQKKNNRLINEQAFNIIDNNPKLSVIYKSLIEQYLFQKSIDLGFIK